MLQHNFKMLVTKTHPLLSQFLSGDVVICDDCILYGVFTKGRDGEDADHDVQDDGEGEAEDEFDDELALPDLMVAHDHGEEGACMMIINKLIMIQ